MRSSILLSSVLSLSALIAPLGRAAVVESRDAACIDGNWRCGDEVQQQLCVDGVWYNGAVCDGGVVNDVHPDYCEDGVRNGGPGQYRSPDNQYNFVYCRCQNPPGFEGACQAAVESSIHG